MTCKLISKFQIYTVRSRHHRLWHKVLSSSSLLSCDWRLNPIFIRIFCAGYQSLITSAYAQKGSHTFHSCDRFGHFIMSTISKDLKSVFFSSLLANQLRLPYNLPECPGFRGIISESRGTFEVDVSIPLGCATNVKGSKCSRYQKILVNPLGNYHKLIVNSPMRQTDII